jgi:hypothetical protein
VTNQARRRRAALRRIADDDPRLAARLILMTLPATAPRNGSLSYVLDVEGLGEHRVGAADGREPDFRIKTDASTLADLATGRRGPLGLMLSGRLRIRGKRRKALKLRGLSSGDLTLRDVVEAGGTLDPDVLYRSLPYLIDPDWTKGHDFTVRYVVGADSWYVTARDGEPLEVTREEREAARQPSRSSPTS